MNFFQTNSHSCLIGVFLSNIYFLQEFILVLLTFAGKKGIIKERAVKGGSPMSENENICLFPISDAPSGDLDILNFVYERIADFPDKYIIQTVYSLRLVTDGRGSLHTSHGVFPLKKGDLFLTFQAKPYKIRNEGDLKYIYISFIGLRADSIFSRLSVKEAQPVFSGKEEFIPLWEKTICSVTDINIDLMAEGLLLLTLADICSIPASAAEKEKRPAEIVKEYIDAHYSNPEISLEEVSRISSYGKKYISESFKKHTGMCFSVYLRNLRLAHAVRMMNSGFTSIKEIASFSGFSDPLYFSKVFKKNYGMPPGEYINSVTDK